MRKAIIDLGTNTFNLLIGEMVDGKLDLIYTDKRPVLLGMGGINENRITQEAILRAIDAILDFIQLSKSLNVDSIETIGTSAIRDAVNQKEFIQKIYDMTQINVEVVTGDREAELIMKGVSLTHKFDLPTLIMDIGGGSTEFILCFRNKVIKSISTNIGVSRLYQQLGMPKEYSAEQRETILSEFEKYRSEFAVFKDAEILLGSSGSFETFYEMINEKTIGRIDKSQEMDYVAFENTLDWTIHSSHDERIYNQYIIPLRKEMIPIASLLIKWVLDIINVQRVYVSPYSLKEGAFAG